MSTAKPHAMLIAIIQAICRNTKSPTVTYYEHAERAVVIGGINPADEGRLIGKKGSVFRSMMVLHFYACRALGISQYTIEPLQTNERHENKAPSFLPRMEWDKAPIVKLIEASLEACFPSAAWVMEREGEDVTVRIRISKALKPDILDPSFDTAIDTIIHGAGKACGANLHTEVIWE